MKLNLFLLISFVLFVSSFSSQVTAVGNASVCCEKTTSGFYCQNVPATECASGYKQAPTACSSTSFCKQGTCFNTGQGICSENTPQLVCSQSNGTWSGSSPPQCDLGCCVLGDQAAFVTLTRCKYLASTLGLQTNFNKQIKDEVQCVLTVQNQDKGACVYDYEFEKYCKFTTRYECNSNANNTGVKGAFFKNKLCTADELGTKCSPTNKTICVPGKDEVYFVDSCGNAANIYDYSKLGSREYWTNVFQKSESCTSSLSNSNSKSCGNCNYLLGSYCRPSSQTNIRPSAGNFICADLNCPKTSKGPKKHGESWCVYDDKGKEDQGSNAVGSRFYKHICINGEEVVEQCADFRQEECIEDSIPISGVAEFSQAACRANRWQNCLAQTDQRDCENLDRRDCIWRTDLDGVLIPGSSGTCIPKNTPGLKFWEGKQTKSICAQASTSCTVTFQKGLITGEKCIDNCECVTEDWKKQKIAFCESLGDCGPKINWYGKGGFKPGYNVTIQDQK